eukprot:TRINITY_DN106126_c0_g1_i1.p1 TRINITY_DN106126_c0_g1~~TRINITY_DN106126_c0_g1_i1.p1  ORF type:complete len:819 (+),score=138.24 TRINITY_DN106126_c0_g1_i1:41-2497(+)
MVTMGLRWVLAISVATAAAANEVREARVTSAGNVEPSVTNGQLPPPDLPMPPLPSSSIIGPTLKDSVNSWTPKRQPLRKDVPNILLIMNDDSGFGHADTFGGPVHTPTFSRLAASGIAYNRFHTTAMCSPTRAALLTGRNHHAVGSGQITELAAGFPGYDGRIPKSAATVAKVLQGYGYDTAAFGKWHNTPVNDLFTTGPFDQYPTGLGFSYFYGFLAGETSQYEPRLFENINPVEPQMSPEQGYHLTEDLVNRTIKFIRNNRALTPERPFFIYLAPGGTHGPHHVHRKWVEKYTGKFDMGWEELRKITFAKQKSQGWIPSNAELTPIDPKMDKWEDVPEKERAFQTRLMEVYAGFLEHTDTQHGRVLDELDRQGLTNNTLVIYVFADNGASAEGMHGTIAELLSQNSLPTSIDTMLKVLDDSYGGLDAIGGPGLDNMYHSSWAWAGDTPFRSTKLVAAHFGGTRTPMVMSWPKVIKHDASPRTQFSHVIDIVPTIYEAVGIKPPGTVDGHEQQAIDGISLVYTFNNASATDRKDSQYFEIMGSRGVYKKGWYACTIGPKIPWDPNATRLAVWDPPKDDWELYNLEDDYSQAHDLAQQMPEKLAEMKEFFMVQAALNKVLPVGAGLYTMVYHPEEAPKSSLTSWTFFEGQTRIAEANAPLYRSGFSSLATISVDIAANASGVIYCVGGTGGGFTVYMDNGFLVAEYWATLVYGYQAKASKPLLPGTNSIQVKLEFVSKTSREASLQLLVNGEMVGGTTVEKSCPVILDASETFDVGMDLGSPVSRNYAERSPFAFEGQINSLSIKYVTPEAGTASRFV